MTDHSQLNRVGTCGQSLTDLEKGANLHFSWTVQFSSARDADRDVQAVVRPSLLSSVREPDPE